jgi:hypothetical protein
LKKKNKKNSHLFQQDFLEHVKPEHIKISVETRSPEGAVVERYAVDLDSFLAHPTLDVAVMQLASDDEKKFKLHNQALPLQLCDHLPQAEQLTSLIGYDISEVKDDVCLPLELEDCAVVSVEENRAIVVTDKTELPPGMSGGAVVGYDDMCNYCYGIIEASLPLEEEDDVNSEHFVHCATFTTSVEIRKWLSNADSPMS